MKSTRCWWDATNRVITVYLTPQQKTGYWWEDGEPSDRDYFEAMGKDQIVADMESGPYTINIVQVRNKLAAQPTLLPKGALVDPPAPSLPPHNCTPVSVGRWSPWQRSRRYIFRTCSCGHVYRLGRVVSPVVRPGVGMRGDDGYNYNYRNP